MAYETPLSHGHGRPKTRSASICAPSSASLETMLNAGGAVASHAQPPSGTGTPENGGTPGYQRRRPATRTQSARITGGRSVSCCVCVCMCVCLSCADVERLEHNNDSVNLRVGNWKQLSASSSLLGACMLLSLCFKYRLDLYLAKPAGERPAIQLEEHQH